MHDQTEQIFISYGRPDQARVIPLYDELCNAGFNVWLDCKKLKPGQNWDFEIKRAGVVQNTHENHNVLLICSRNQWRSPTAEQIFRKHPLLSVRSAGTSPNARRKVSAADVH